MSSAVAPIALAAACVAACRAPVEPLPPGVVDLLAPARAPVLVAETGSVEPRDPAVLGGFHARGDDADGTWAGEGPVRVALGFTDARPRTIEIEALGYAWPGAPPVRVAASLDGVPIGGFEAAGDAWRRHRLAVPGDLSVPGRHLLELAPSRAVAPAEVDPASDDPRRLSIRVRGLRVLPEGNATPAPELTAEGVLRLPCGSRAEWPVWAPPGASLEVEARLRRAREAFLAVERDGEPARRLALGGEGRRQRLPLPPAPRALAPAPAASPGGAPALLVAGCTGVGGELEIRRLRLESPAPPTPRTARPPGKALLVVGAMGSQVPQGAGGAGGSGDAGSEEPHGAQPGDWASGGAAAAVGFLAAPCSTAAPRALACLITGRESAAFGYPAEPPVGRVAESAGEAAEWLAAAPAPAVAVLLAPGRPARELAAAVAGRVEGLSVIVTRLPRGPEQLALPVEVHDGLASRAAGAARSPIPGEPAAPAGLPAGAPLARAELFGASQVDLLPTLYSLAGAAPPPVLSGADLLPLLERSPERGLVAVRPAAAVWDDHRSRAVRGRHVLSLPVAGGVFPRTILDRVLAARVARRRADLAWLGDLPPAPAPRARAASVEPAAPRPPSRRPGGAP